MTVRLGHRKNVPDGQLRMVLLTDDRYLTYIGNRAWCNAERHRCNVCGGRCCACRHVEFDGRGEL